MLCPPIYLLMSDILLTHFESLGSSLLSAHPSLNGRWSICRVDRRVEFSILPLDEAGFEVGATCEEWGILPKAGPWEDVPWEPYEWSIEQMCSAYFGLVRALISPDAQVRVQYAHGRALKAAVELLMVDGWFVFDEAPLTRGQAALLPYEVILQNTHLPSRQPFAGLIPTGVRTYPWSHGA